MLKFIYTVLFSITVIFTLILQAQDKEVTFLRPYEDGEIVIKKIEDVSLVEIKRSFIEFSDNGKYNLGFIAQFIRVNKQPTNVPIITLAFYSNSKDCKFPEDLDTKSEILIDGKKSSLSNKLDKNEIAKFGGGFANYNELEGDVCNGMYSMYLLKRTFLKFASAKQVQVKIGEYKFELKPHNIKALSNMAKLLIPKKK